MNIALLIIDVQEAFIGHRKDVRENVITLLKESFLLMILTIPWHLINILI